MVIGRPEHAGTDLEGEFSNSNLVSITLKKTDKIDTDAGVFRFRSRLTAEDFQTVNYTKLDPATWTEIYNPLFIVSAEATYP